MALPRHDIIACGTLSWAANETLDGLRQPKQCAPGLKNILKGYSAGDSVGVSTLVQALPPVSRHGNWMNHVED